MINKIKTAICNFSLNKQQSKTPDSMSQKMHAIHNMRCFHGLMVCPSQWRSEGTLRPGARNNLAPPVNKNYRV